MRSEGLNLSPVEFAGHGPDLLGLTVIEGSPEALQTAATSAPITIKTDEQTETPHNITIVPTPALDLGADNTHPASSVYGAGAAGSGPPPSGPGAAPSMISSFRDPSLAPNMLRPTAMDYQTFTEHEPSLLTQPRLYSSTQTTYDVEQSQSALENIGQFGSERSSKDTLEIGDDIEPEIKVPGVSEFFKLLASSQPTTALGARPKQAAAPRDTSALAAGLRQPLQPVEIHSVTSANVSSSAFSWPSSAHQPSLLKPRGESTSFRPPSMYTSDVLARHTDVTLRHTTHDAVAAQSLLTLGRPSSRASRTEKKAYTPEQRSPQDSVHEWLTAVTTTGPLDQPPSIAESHVTSIGRDRQSSLPMGADAALIQPVQSVRSTRLTRRSSSSASVVLAELLNFARGTTESMLNLYDRNRADAIAREQTLIQDANRREQDATRREQDANCREQTLVQDANRREQEAARRDELAHFEKQKMREMALAEKQKMRDEAKARDEIALSEKQKMRDEAKATEELAFREKELVLREKEQLRNEACKREEANLKREQSYMQAELKRKEIETAAATEIQKQQMEAIFKMQAIERREIERYQEK